jgi:hypothetical protein
MNFALMFNVLEGGVSEPIKWSKENFTPDRCIIVLDEMSQTVWLFHGSKQGLIAKRTALRQAESLKGHGFAVGKSIIGRDLKSIKEIDQRKIGREPETDKLNQEFQELLKKEYKEMDNFIVTFGPEEIPPVKEKPEPKPVSKPEPKMETKLEPKPVSKPEPKIEAKPEKKSMAKPEVKPISSATSKPINIPKIASEYEVKEEPLASVKSAELKTVKEEIKGIRESLLEEARVAFVIKAVIDIFPDIWVSKKSDGNYAIEMLDGPVCQFTIKEGTIKFSTNSFSSLNPSIKTEIQKKYVELSKL